MAPVVGEILPILFACVSVNHRLPSGPAAIPFGPAWAVGTSYSVTFPVTGDILPILFPLASVNHKLPSGPVIIGHEYSPPGESNVTQDVGGDDPVDSDDVVEDVVMDVLVIARVLLIVVGVAKDVVAVRCWDVVMEIVARASGGVFELAELQALNPKIHTVINNKLKQIHFFILTPKSPVDHRI
jgi:hypothetical protein